MAWKNVQYENGKYRTSEGGGGGSSTFAGLDDVSFSDLQNGQVPKYNSTTQKWENANESGGGGTVTDVEVDGVSVVNQQGVAKIITPDASGIEYDNQQSGLSATDVQSAIDELAQGSGGGGVEDVEVNGTSVVNAQNVAEITSYKEVTQAEYQALPSSKLNDNILYCIKDSAGADGFPPLIYSDEEREIGVWRDGKPLYQKTFVSNYSFHTKSSQTVNIDIHDLNIDTPVAINGFWRRWAGDDAKLWYQFGSEEAQYGIGWARIDSENNYSNGQLAIKITSDGSDCQIVTLQYTKTTDTAGSGTWTTQGGYAHHYSTTEQVIGTWTDGKPLYEKVITGLSVNLAWHNQFRTEGTFSNAPTNIDTLVYIDGYGPSNGNHKAHFGITVYDYGSSSWSLFSLQDGTVTTLILQYTKTTD